VWGREIGKKETLWRSISEDRAVKRKENIRKKEIADGKLNRRKIGKFRIPKKRKRKDPWGKGGYQRSEGGETTKQRMFQHNANPQRETGLESGGGKRETKGKLVHDSGGLPRKSTRDVYPVRFCAEGGHRLPRESGAEALSLGGRGEGFTTTSPKVGGGRKGRGRGAGEGRRGPKIFVSSF